MSYKIICDSCTDLPSKLKKNDDFVFVPLILHVDDVSIIDDETFDQKDFIKRMKESEHCPKSSCPSPDSYMKYFDQGDDIYVITLSAALSGSYNSALLAKNLYLEENPHKNIAIIDSRSASVGQALLALKVQELAKKGMKFQEIEKTVEQFRDEMGTKFVLESLDNLRKNGRLTGLKAIVASVLNIKPVMGATNEGTIIQVDQGRGMTKALALLAKAVEEDVVNPEDKILGIAHCNNYERAVYVKEQILKRLKFKDVIIVEMAGVSTLYANDGGIIACY